MKRVIAVTLLITMLSVAFSMSNGGNNIEIDQKENFNVQIDQSQKIHTIKTSVNEIFDPYRDNIFAYVDPEDIEGHVKMKQDVIKSFLSRIEKGEEIQGNIGADIFRCVDYDLKALPLILLSLSYKNTAPDAKIETLTSLSAWNRVINRSNPQVTDIVRNKKLGKNYFDTYANRIGVDKEEMFNFYWKEFEKLLLEELNPDTKSDLLRIHSLISLNLVFQDIKEEKNIEILNYYVSGMNYDNWKGNKQETFDKAYMYYLSHYGEKALYTTDKIIDENLASKQLLINFLNEWHYKSLKYHNNSTFIRKLKQNSKSDILIEKANKILDRLNVSQPKEEIKQKSTGSLYNEIWKPDSSSVYCVRYWGKSDDEDPDYSAFDWTYYNNADYNHYSNLPADTSGADCANYGSQCLIAGGIDLSKATGNICNTHPCGETTIINCDNLDDFLKIKRSDFKTQTNTNSSTTIPSWYRAGDVAIVGDATDVLKHTIICHSDVSGTYEFGCHTANRLNKSLSWWLGSSYADRVTFYHVIGSTVLENPSQDSLIVALGDTLNLQALVTNNTEPTSLNPITNFKFVLKKKPENTVATLWETTSAPPSADSTYVYDFETALQDTGRYILYANTTYTTGSTQDSCIVKIKAYPEIQTPSNNEIIHVRSSTKGTVQDTVAIKVKVPEVLSSYPSIKIKIDDVYVNQGDIIFDPAENLWVYNWVVSSINPGSEGKRFLVVAEINGTPSCYDATGVYLVEAIIFEDFENFSFGEWSQWGSAVPANANIPWSIGINPTNSIEKTVRSTTGYTTYTNYKLLSPNIVIPDSSLNKTKMEFDIYWDYSGSLWSNLYMYICDSSGNPIETGVLLPKSYRTWWHYNYDLSKYSGQTISIRLDNYHNFNPSYVIFTRYCVDNFLIYAIPDMDCPNIDFISGNSAELNEDMNLIIQFNDTSGIDGVTADYSIESDSDTITLYPVKGTYNYTGTISARDHECLGSISFKIKDSVGNETISGGHSIGWTIGGGGLLTAPQNVVMTVVNDSTLTITWDMVVGATGYKVYSSLDPCGSFTEDTTGTFTSSREWQKTFDGNKYFYYVVATDAVKEEEFEILVKDISDR